MKSLCQKRIKYLNRHSKRVANKLRKINKKRDFNNKRKKRICSINDSFQRSDLLKLIGDGYLGAPRDKRFYHPSFPDNFSLLNNPKNTLKSILRLARFANNRKKSCHLRIDQSGLASCDIAAIALLDIVLMEMRDEVEDGNAPNLDLEGIIPVDPEMETLVRAIGTPNHLNIVDAQIKLGERIKLKLEIFDKRVTTRKKIESPILVETREKIAEDFILHVSRCLTATKAVEINEDGVTHLSAILAEIINNAEEHAGMTDWSLLGYLNFKQEIPVLEVAMINFGKTMAQTFQALDRGSYTWDQIGPYVSEHVGSRLFSSSWKEEDLLTVMALQPNISSKNETAKSTRGAGTTQLLEFFEFMDSFFHGMDRSAQMAIISGSTYIYFDGKYRLQQSGNRKAIAFNAANDLSKRPDKSYVQHLSDVSFPGTIISIKLPLPVVEAND